MTYLTVQDDTIESSPASLAYHGFWKRVRVSASADFFRSSKKLTGDIIDGDSKEPSSDPHTHKGDPKPIEAVKNDDPKPSPANHLKDASKPPLEDKEKDDTKFPSQDQQNADPNPPLDQQKNDPKPPLEDIQKDKLLRESGKQQLGPQESGRMIYSSYFFSFPGLNTVKFRALRG